MARTGRKKRRARQGRIRGWLRGAVGALLGLLWWIGVRVAVVAVVLAVAAGTLYYASRIPDLDALLDAREGGSVTMLDADGPDLRLARAAARRDRGPTRCRRT